MGTSTSNKGTKGNGTPLVPSWLNIEEQTENVSVESAVNTPYTTPEQHEMPIVPPEYPPVPPQGDPQRYKDARSNFTRFAKSGGTDRPSMKRAVADYVSKSSGGAKNAAQNMGSSRKTSARLVGFLADVAQRGIDEVLRSLSLETLVGQPIEDIFTGLSDYICPEGGTVDIGIAKSAFIETIADLAEAGIDMNSLNIDQIQTVLELYTTHAIEDKIINEIGTKAISLPSDQREVENVQNQLHDFIKNAVSDALTTTSSTFANISQQNVLYIVNGVYEEAFNILLALSSTNED